MDSAVPVEPQPSLERKKFSPSPASLPSTLIQTHQISGIPTTVTAQLYSDRTFLALSQLSGKVGTLLSVTVEDSVIDMSRTFHVSIVLGNRDDPFPEVLARNIGERIAATAGPPGTLGDVEGGVCPPLLIGVGLKRKARGDLRPDVDEFNTFLDLLSEAYANVSRLESA